MDRPTRGAVPPDDVARHPAFLAWRELCPQARPPASIEILKPEKRKSAVYRLADAGPSGAAVIAKRQREGYLDVERRLYAEVLPDLPLPTLDVYGFLESWAGYAWLFLEDAGEEWYSPKADAHRRLAADWLAALHTAGTSPVPWLPRTGPAFQLTVLRRARDGVRSSACHPTLTPAGVATLERILRCLDRAEEHWCELEAVSDGVPEALVHGDFVPKNVRIRRRRDRQEVVAFDWETSGWATPAVDLGLLPPGPASLRAYQERLRAAGWALPRSRLVQLKAVGDVYRLLNCVHWESRSFEHEWIERPIARMQVYEQRLGAAVERSLGLVRAA